MQKMLTRKNVIWTLVLLLTTWLTWQTYQQNAEVPVVSSVRVVRPMQAGSFSNRDFINGGSATKPVADAKSVSGLFVTEPRVKASKPFFNLFAIPAKQLEKVAAHAEKPAAPVAPALPFKYMGSVTEMNQTKVILDDGGEVLAVKVGDSLGVSYKLVSMNKVANSTELLFLYLPMNITQTMVVKDVSEH